MSCQIRQKRPASAQRAKIVMCGHSLGEICVLPPENTCHFGSALTKLHTVRMLTGVENHENNAREEDKRPTVVLN